MVALGAKPKQLMAFLRGEAAVIFVAGSLLGALTGVTVAWMLVALLTGVFDPPPDGLTIPWLYLVVLFAAVGASVALAVGLAERRIEVSPILVLREESR